MLTLFHDLDYLHNHDQTESDDRAIKATPYDLPGIATKIGLSLRKALGLKFNNKSEDFQAYDLYKLAKENNKDLIEKYNIDMSPYDAFQSHNKI